MHNRRQITADQFSGAERSGAGGLADKRSAGKTTACCTEGLLQHATLNTHANFLQPLLLTHLHV